jgi:hypothetical protein
MSGPAFEVALREDGSLDPACLERMGERWTAQWLRERLSGRDPYIPIDRRTDEDPEALVVDLLRQEGPSGTCSLAIARAALALLDDARRSAPQIPPYFPALLRLCEQVRMTPTSTWFLDELTALSRDPASVECRWGSAEIIEEILFAARRQTPGLPESPAHDLWLGLLRQPRFATMALLGLGTSFARLVAHLPVWWRTSPPGERSRELGEIVFQALSTEGEDAVRAALAAVGPGWQPELKAAVDREMRANGLTSSLSRVKAAHASATLNAGWKREEHLAAA